MRKAGRPGFEDCLVVQQVQERRSILNRADVIRLAKAHHCKTELEHGEVVEYYEFFADGLVSFAAMVEAEARKEMEADAARYQALRRGQHWSVIDGLGDALRAEQLDAVIDRSIRARTKPAPGGAS